MIVFAMCREGGAAAGDGMMCDCVILLLTYIQHTYNKCTIIHTVLYSRTLGYSVQAKGRGGGGEIFGE